MELGDYWIDPESYRQLFKKLIAKLSEFFFSLDGFYFWIREQLHSIIEIELAVPILNDV